MQDSFLDRLGGRVCGGYLNTVCGCDSWDVGGQWVARLVFQILVCFKLKSITSIWQVSNLIEFVQVSFFGI